MEPAFKDKIPNNYTKNADNATIIFKHALVFNIKSKNLEYFHPLPIDNPLTDDQIKLLGQPFPQYISKKVFKGEY